jgi:hypothetical protein
MSNSFPSRRVLLPGASLTLALSACASPGSGVGGGDTGLTVVTTAAESFTVTRPAEFRADQPVPVSPGNAWSELPGVYARLGLAADVRDEGQRRLGVSQHRFSGQILGRRASDFFDCGTDPGLMRPLADQSPIDAQVLTTVLGGPGGEARLRTEISASARRTGGAAGRAECRSTGLLEVVIARMVEAPDRR